jgi:hypothetical protein
MTKTIAEKLPLRFRAYREGEAPFTGGAAE